MSNKIELHRGTLTVIGEQYNGKKLEIVMARRPGVCKETGCDNMHVIISGISDGSKPLSICIKNNYYINRLIKMMENSEKMVMWTTFDEDNVGHEKQPFSASDTIVEKMHDGSYKISTVYMDWNFAGKGISRYAMTLYIDEKSMDDSLRDMKKFLQPKMPDKSSKGSKSKSSAKGFPDIDVVFEKAGDQVEICIYDDNVNEAIVPIKVVGDMLGFMKEHNDSNGKNHKEDWSSDDLIPSDYDYDEEFFLEIEIVNEMDEHMIEFLKEDVKLCKFTIYNDDGDSTVMMTRDSLINLMSDIV